MKTVLHLRSSGGMLGAESVIIELGKYTPEFGYKSIIGAVRNANDPFPEFINAAKANSIETAVFDAKSSFDPGLPSRIKKYIIDNGIDIVHCHGYKEDFYVFFARTDVPVIATNHLWKRTTWKNKIYAFIDSYIMKHFDHVAGVSGEIVKEMNTLGINKTSQIDNGVDIKKYFPHEKDLALLNKFSLDKGNTVLGMISSLTPEKGHAVAIDAFCEIAPNHPEARLFIIGDGLLRPDIENSIIQKGLNNKVIMAGRQSDIPGMLSIIDIFLLPSFKEGLPMALLEAMSAGKAVVATTVGENANVITNNVNGLLIPPGNPSALAASIISLIEDKKKFEELGKNARSLVENRFSSLVMAEKYCRLYESILKK